jgi:hypothetical protein
LKVSAATFDVGQAINLRRSDVPAMRQVLPEGETARLAPAAKRKCGRVLSLFEEPGGFHSPTFTQGGGPQSETVRSAVRVAPSEAAAAHRLAATASASFLACYERYLQSTARRLSATPAAVSVSALPFPLPGVSESLGLRITRRPSHPAAEQPPSYTDILEFASGRVVVALTAIRASQPFPVATERRLLSLLLGRAKANEL